MSCPNPPLSSYASPKYGAFPPARLCCPGPPQYYAPLRLPPCYRDFRLPPYTSTFLRWVRLHQRAREGLPSSSPDLVRMPRPIRRRGSGCLARPSSGLLPSPTSARLGPLGTSRFYTFDAADFALCCGLRTCSLLGFDAPLRHRTLPRCREPATGPSGGYPDRTFTGWPDDASSGHTKSCGNSLQLMPS